MYEGQHKYKLGFSRPEIRIKREDNEKIKAFVSNKGYNSINDYLNALLYADMQYNFIPDKSTLEELYPAEQ